MLIDKALVLVGRDWAMASGNDLPFDLPEDLTYFRDQTKGQLIIVGRRTLETFPNGKPLPGRLHIVMTKDRSFRVKDHLVAHNVMHLNNLLYHYKKDKEVILAGGEEIYKMLLPSCKEAYVSIVDLLVDNPTHYFPRVDLMTFWTKLGETKAIPVNGVIDPSFRYGIVNYKNLYPIDLRDLPVK